MSEAEQLAQALEEPMPDFPAPTTLEAEAAAELRRLSAEVEALRKDAERYRWLVDQSTEPSSVVSVVRAIYRREKFGGYRQLIGKEINTAIDAAMIAARPGEKHE